MQLKQTCGTRPCIRFSVYYYCADFNKQNLILNGKMPRINLSKLKDQMSAVIPPSFLHFYGFLKRPQASNMPESLEKLRHSII